MTHDLLAIFASILVWPLLAVAPGYAATLLCDPLGVSRRSWGYRLLLALPLSLAVTPIVTHLLWRFIGINAVWAFLGLCAIVTLGHALRSPREIVSAFSRHRAIVLAGFVWAAIVVAIMLPLQIGESLYLSYPWTDYSKHVAMTSTITRTGVPPINPYYAPGQLMPTYYYYGWFVQSSLVHQLGGSVIGPQAAVVGGDVWTGLALIACLIAFARFILPEAGPAIAARRDRWLLVLLLVTGLDLIPTILWDGSSLLRGRDQTPHRSAENWNEQITSWIDVTLWVPHHVSGAIMAIMGLMLLRAASEGASRVNLRIAILAGLAFASAAFMSIYLGMAAAIAGGTWAVVCVRSRRYVDSRALVLAGAIAAILLAPYIQELRVAKLITDSPLAIRVREFYPATGILLKMGIEKNTLLAQAVYAACLPLNYALELGFFGFAGWIYLRRLRTPGERFSTNDKFAIAIAASLLVFCTFVKSALVNNDLGWRAFVPIQAVLLVWAVDVMLRRQALAPRLRMAAWALLVFGLLSSGLNLVMLRGTQFLDVALGSPRWDPDGAADLRDAHNWIARHTPKEAIVQYPPVEKYDFVHGDYCQRQVAIGDPIYGTVLGIPERLYRPWKDRLDGLFAKSTMSWDGLRTLDDLRVDYLIVTRDQPLWQARSEFTPAVVFENPNVAVLEVTKVRQRVAAATP